MSDYWLKPQPLSKIRIETEADGKLVVMEGTARDVAIDTQYDYENAEVDALLDSPRIFKTGATSTLTAEFVGNYTVTKKKAEPEKEKVIRVYYGEGAYEGYLDYKGATTYVVDDKDRLNIYKGDERVVTYNAGRWNHVEKGEK